MFTTVTGAAHTWTQRRKPSNVVTCSSPGEEGQSNPNTSPECSHRLRRAFCISGKQRYVLIVSQEPAELKGHMILWA